MAVSWKVEKRHVHGVNELLEHVQRRYPPNDAPRRARAEGEHIYVESRDGGPRQVWVRLHRRGEDAWMIEELRANRRGFYWQGLLRRPISLSSVAARWDDAKLRNKDLRLGFEPSLVPAVPAQAPTSASVRERLAKELTEALAASAPWAKEQMAKLASYEPLGSVRRMHLEWSTFELARGAPAHLRLWILDRDDDWDGQLKGIRFRQRRLVAAALASRVEELQDGHVVAQAVLTGWLFRTVTKQARALKWPLYLSEHDGLPDGVDLKTGRRRRFRQQ